MTLRVATDEDLKAVLSLSNLWWYNTSKFPDFSEHANWLCNQREVHIFRIFLLFIWIFSALWMNQLNHITQIKKIIFIAKQFLHHLQNFNYVFEKKCPFVLWNVFLKRNIIVHSLFILNNYRKSRRRSFAWRLAMHCDFLFPSFHSK